MMDLMTLSVGPKKCDLEVRNLKTGKPIGRIQSDLHFKQLQTMQVTLEDLTCKFNYKEEKPHFVQFKAITTNQNPIVSEKLLTQTGKFKKDKNQTKFKWRMCDTLYE